MYIDADGVMHFTNAPTESDRDYRVYIRERSRYRSSNSYAPDKYDDLISVASKQYGVDHRLVKAIIKDEEVKYLRMNMHRDVSAEKMSSTISESFEEHMPKGASAELRKQRKTFEGYFKDECTEGSVLEFTYLPGTGTILKQNGKQLGPALTGKAFQEVLWDIYFGKDTCCDDLLEQILETCKKR